jgi:hypothetical protein
MFLVGSIISAVIDYGGLVDRAGDVRVSCFACGIEQHSGR